MLSRVSSLARDELFYHLSILSTFGPILPESLWYYSQNLDFFCLAFVLQTQLVISCAYLKNKVSDLDPEGKIKGKLRLTNKIWGYFFVENIFFKSVFFTFKRGVQINLMILLTWIRILIHQILRIRIPSIRIHSLNKLISNLYWLTN